MNNFLFFMIILVDVYATELEDSLAMTESITDDYDYSVEGLGSGEYSTTRPKRDMAEINTEKETTTCGL